MTFSIEKGIPLTKPHRGHRSISETRAALEKALAMMEKGDSVFVPKESMSRATLMKAVASVKSATGHQFTTRTVVESGQDGVRVWRTA